MTTSSIDGFSFSFSSVRHKIYERADRLKDRTIELPCGTKFVWEFMFADQRFFVFFLLGINFLQFAESPGQIIDNVFDFIEYLQPVNE